MNIKAAATFLAMLAPSFVVSVDPSHEESSAQGKLGRKITESSMSLASMSLDLIGTSTVGMTEEVRVKGVYTAEVKQVGVNVRMQGIGEFGSSANTSPPELVWAIEGLVAIRAYCEAPKGTIGPRNTDLKLGT